MRPQYIETLMNIRQVIAKGYLDYEPGDLYTTGTAWEHNNHRVVSFQDTFVIYRLK